MHFIIIGYIIIINYSCKTISDKNYCLNYKYKLNKLNI